jgi:hypothetical protein
MRQITLPNLAYNQRAERKSVIENTAIIIHRTVALGCAFLG